jgi:hypothetical protein
MADIGVNRHWLVDPTREIEEGWIQVQIQEKVSQINRTKQDIEDLQKGRIKQLQTNILMLEREKAKLETDLLRSRSMSADEVSNAKK